MTRFVNLPDRRLIEISGKDRGSFLQGLFSQDVAKNFPVGSAVYGIFPNPKGRVLADAFIVHVDSERFLIDVDSAISEKLLAHLNQYIILSDVSIRRLPKQRAISIFDGKAEDVGGFSISRKGFHEQRVWSEEPGLIERLKKSGAIEVEFEAYEIILAEHLIPKIGREMDETTFPQEVGLDEVLNFKKGCFLGAEVLQRIFYQGHVNRKLTLIDGKLTLVKNQ